MYTAVETLVDATVVLTYFRWMLRTVRRTTSLCEKIALVRKGTSQLSRLAVACCYLTLCNVG